MGPFFVYISIVHLSVIFCSIPFNFFDCSLLPAIHLYALPLQAVQHSRPLSAPSSQPSVLLAAHTSISSGYHYYRGYTAKFSPLSIFFTYKKLKNSIFYSLYWFFFITNYLDHLHFIINSLCTSNPLLLSLTCQFIKQYISQYSNEDRTPFPNLN